MSKDPWIKWFPGDFLHGVSELEANEGWVYTIVLNLIYDAGGPWPLSVDRLSRRCRLRPTTVEKVLGTLYDLGKLTLADGCLMNGKAEKSIKSRQKVSENSAEAANARWEKERAKSNENNGPDHATAMQTLCGSDANQKLEARTREEEEANASSVAESDLAGPKPKADRRTYPEAFEDAWLAYPHTKGRSSKPLALARWQKLPKAERDLMPAAAARFAPNVAAVCGGKGAPDMAVWIGDGKHLNWLDDDAAPATKAPTFTGPAGLRAAVVAAKDEDFAVGYLDPCGWEDGPPRRLVARNAYIAEQITKAIGAQLQRAGVEVVTSPSIIAEFTRERISA